MLKIKFYTTYRKKLYFNIKKYLIIKIINIKYKYLKSQKEMITN